jgi:hypothetical protein
MNKLTGRAAIDYAAANGLTLNAYSSPIDDARSGLTVDEAREEYRDDLNLLWVEAEESPVSIETENAILSIGHEFLPAVALKVIRGDGLTPAEATEYKSWLAEQAAGMAAE